MSWASVSPKVRSQSTVIDVSEEIQSRRSEGVFGLDSDLNKGAQILSRDFGCLKFCKNILDFRHVGQLFFFQGKLSVARGVACVQLFQDCNLPQASCSDVADGFHLESTSCCFHRLCPSWFGWDWPEEIEGSQVHLVLCSVHIDSDFKALGHPSSHTVQNANLGRTDGVLEAY